MFDENQLLHQEAPQETPQEQPQQPQDSQKEINLRILRERAENAERRSQELERMIQLQNQQQAPRQEIPQEDDDLDVEDDTYIEGRKFKKYVKNLKQELRNTKKQFEEFNQKNAMMNAEVRLKSQFSDFDSIVSKENIEKLATLKPAVYRSIMASQDIYDRGYTAYEMIKHSGIAESGYSQADRKLEDNRSKPRAVSNVSPQIQENPLAKVGDYDRRTLSESDKDRLRRQVEEAKKYR